MSYLSAVFLIVKLSGSLPSADSFGGKRSDKLSGEVNVAVRISGSVFYYGFAGNRFQLFDLIETVKLFFRDCIRCKINIRKHVFILCDHRVFCRRIQRRIPGGNMIFFCLDIPNAKKMKHERIIGSKQRDPVIDSDRCIQHVIIQVGVSAVCHRRIHRTSCYFRFWGRGFRLQAVRSGCQNDRADPSEFPQVLCKFFCRNICFLYPVFLSGSCNIHTDRGDQYEQIDE